MSPAGSQIEQEHTQSIARFQAEHARLQSRIDSAYVDSLDGHTNKAMFKDLVA